MLAAIDWPLIGKITVAAAGVAAATVAVLRYTAERRVERNRRKPPFCIYCGLSNHVPVEERNQPCPRNPKGIGHTWEPVA